MIDAQRFPIESYAGNHPAGAIGRALILQVTDVMRKGERMAKVGMKATVLETLMAMTAAKAGSAVVVTEDGRLAGIFTDGDFRRHVTSGKDILQNAVVDYMTAFPKFIRSSALAVDALRVFEALHIDDLPVCDDAGVVVGLVDIQDLPKMKVL